MEAKVSVIVPVYNKKPFLRVCLDSITKQTYQNLEIILVDDGSTDGSGQICEEYRDRDARVRVIHQVHRNVGASRNTGLAMSTGDEIAFIDGDDWVEPDYIQTLHDLMQRKQADIAIGSFMEFFNDKKAFAKFYVFENAHEETLYTAAQWFKKRGEEDVFSLLFTVTWGKLFRRQLLSNVTFPDVSMAEDDYTTWKIYLLTDRIAYTSQVKYVLRRFAPSVTAHVKPQQLMPLASVISRLTMLNLLGMDTSFDENDYLQRLRAIYQSSSGDLDEYLTHRNSQQIMNIINKYRS